MATAGIAAGKLGLRGVGPLATPARREPSGPGLSPGPRFSAGGQASVVAPDLAALVAAGAFLLLVTVLWLAVRGGGSAAPLAGAAAPRRWVCEAASAGNATRSGYFCWPRG